MATPFENFVNTELPKRISTDADPLSVSAGKIFVTTGIGLGVIPKTIEELGLGGGTGGKSAYEIAVDNGYVGSETEWLASLQGASAYELAVKHGYTGTEQQWVDATAVFFGYVPEDAGKVLMNTGTGSEWRTYPFSDEFKAHMQAAGFTYDEVTGSWKIDQGHL